MRIRLTAEQEELSSPDAPERVLGALSKAFEGHAPEVADALHKAISPPAVGHHQKVLRQLHERLRGAYAAQMREMMADINKVLNRAKVETRKSSARGVKA